jgi:RNA polymerase sigma-70 factor (ECF subfamily)
MTLVTNECTDRRLLRQLNNGDKHAFLSVYDVLAPKIYRFIFYKTGNDRDLAEDLTQDTFIKIWDHIVAPHKRIKNIQAFVYCVARNTVIAHWRKCGRHEIVSFNDEIESSAEGTAVWREEYDKKLTREVITQALTRIPTQYCEILTLRFVEELDTRTISGIVEKKTSTVRVLIHRAMKCLKSELQKEECE